MSVISEMHRVLAIFPLAQEDMIRSLLDNSVDLEIYLSEMHDLTLQEVRETLSITRLSWSEVPSKAA